MAIKAGLGLKLGQQLTMTPALQQAIKLLQISSMDLMVEIQDALDSNLMLEADESIDDGDFPEPPSEASDSDEAAPLSEDIPEQPDNDFEWDDVYVGSSSDVAAQEALYEYRQASLHRAPSLIDHLAEQAGLHPFDPNEATIALHIIDAIDERGWIEDWDELAQRLGEETGQSPQEIEAVLRSVQAFDPPGIAARSLSECLILQIDERDEDPQVADCAKLIAQDYLDELAAKDLRALARASDAEPQTLTAAMALIRRLDPHPGSQFAEDRTEYVAPDVFVFKREGEWMSSLNPEIAPNLRINQSYQKLIKRSDSSPDAQTMRSHLAEARYFLNSLKARNDTLMRVAQTIVDRQRAFLDYGDEAMKPLVLRDIAEKLGVHESTVSRATANKYMHTPRGLFELKYFFSSSVPNTEGGSSSATAIQAMIRRLVNEENSAKPLSDSRLTSLLLTEGVNVARRTVAKYREGLGIPPSHERRVSA